MLIGISILSGILGIGLIATIYLGETRAVLLRTRISDLEEINKALQQYIESTKQNHVTIEPVTSDKTVEATEQKKSYKRRGPKRKHNVRREDKKVK